MSGIGNTQNLSFLQQGIQNRVNFTNPAGTGQLVINKFSIVNGSGGAEDVGHGIGLPLASQKIATKVGSVYTTKNAPIGSTVLFTTTNNDGFLVYGKRPFGLVSFAGPSGAAGSPVYTFEYYNGSAFTALTLNQTPDYSVSGANVMTFNAPPDWALGDGGLTSNSTYYAIRILATTAPSAPYAVFGMNMARWIQYSFAVAAGVRTTVNFTERPLLLESTESPFSYVSTVSVKNSVELLYQIGG